MSKCNIMMADNSFIVDKYKWLFLLSLISIQTASCSRLDIGQYQTTVMDRPSGQMPCPYIFFPMCKLDSQYCSNTTRKCFNYLDETTAVEFNVKHCLIEVETNIGVTVQEKGALDVCYYFLGKNAKMLIQNSQQWCKPNEFYNFTTWQCELIFFQGQSLEEKCLKCETFNNTMAPKEILAACKDLLLELKRNLERSLSQHKCLLKGTGMYFNETTGQCVPVFPKNATENEQLSFCESGNSDLDHMEVISACNKFLLEYVKKPRDQCSQGENWSIATFVILIFGAVGFVAEKVGKKFCSNINRCKDEVPQNQSQEDYNLVPSEESHRAADDHDRNKQACKRVETVEKDNNTAGK